MSRRRGLLAAAGAILALGAVAAPGASAAPATITGSSGGGGDLFDAAAYSHDAGTVATLVVTSGTHDVDSTQKGPDGEALFESELIGAGSTPVSGTQYLTAGSYPFICSIHPSTMQATLNVAGTPLPRPEVKVKVKSTSLDQAVRSRAVKVKVTITGGSGEQVDVSLRLGKKKIGSGSTTRTKTVKARLTSKGLSALENKAKAKLKAEAKIDFGTPAKATGVLK